MDYIVDFDDFYEDNNDLDILFRLRSQIPGFKVNLFTIPGRCSTGFIKEIQRIDWIDMIPHGYTHESNYECMGWSYPTALGYLDMIEQLRLTRGFKAPGWQISDGTYQALLHKGYWVADQAYNNERRPVRLKTYIIDSPEKIHGHIGHLGGENKNALTIIYMMLLGLQGTFHFIRDKI